MIKDFLTNTFFNYNKYKTHSEAVIVACYYNFKKSKDRLNNFNTWYDSIKHLNHRIIECVLDGEEPELPESPYIDTVYTQDILWHKETLLNKAIKDLPSEFKYVFWVDTDTIFTNLNWLRDGVYELKNNCVVVQPFEYCYHLAKGETKPDSSYTGNYKFTASFPANDGYLKDCNVEKRIWKSFAANYYQYNSDVESNVYDTHGHVGFAWGARRELLDKVELFDFGLSGGSDHIIAHATVNQIPSECISKSFTDNLDDVYKWSREWSLNVKTLCHFNKYRELGYIKGDLYHLYHGDIKKREYLKRIKEFTPLSLQIKKKDENGLWTVDENDSESRKYMNDYFTRRETGENESSEVSTLDTVPTFIFDYGTREYVDTSKSTEESFSFGGAEDNFKGGGGGGEWKPNVSSGVESSLGVDLSENFS